MKIVGIVWNLLMVVPIAFVSSSSFGYVRTGTVVNVSRTSTELSERKAFSQILFVLKKAKVQTSSTADKPDSYEISQVYSGYSWIGQIWNHRSPEYPLYSSHFVDAAHPEVIISDSGADSVFGASGAQALYQAINYGAEILSIRPFLSEGCEKLPDGVVQGSPSDQFCYKLENIRCDEETCVLKFNEPTQ